MRITGTVWHANSSNHQQSFDETGDATPLLDQRLCDILDTYDHLPDIPEGVVFADGTPCPAGALRDALSYHFAPLAEWEATHGPWSGVRYAELAGLTGDYVAYGVSDQLDLFSHVRDDETGQPVIISALVVDTPEREASLRAEYPNFVGTTLTDPFNGEVDWHEGMMVAMFRPVDTTELVNQVLVDRLHTERESVFAGADPWRVSHQTRSDSRWRAPRIGHYDTWKAFCNPSSKPWTPWKPAYARTGSTG